MLAFASHYRLPYCSTAQSFLTEGSPSCSTAQSSPSDSSQWVPAAARAADVLSASMLWQLLMANKILSRIIRGVLYSGRSREKKHVCAMGSVLRSGPECVWRLSLCFFAKSSGRSGSRERPQINRKYRHFSCKPSDRGERWHWFRAKTRCTHAPHP